MGLSKFLKKLFQDKAESQPAAAVEYHGYLITPVPKHANGEFYTSGIISKIGASGTHEARFIRADRHASEAQAQQHAIQKGKQIIDEQGDTLFEQDHL